MDVAALFLGTLRLGPDSDSARLRDAWVHAPLAGVAELAAFEGCTLWLYQRLRGRAVLDALPRTFADALERVARREAAQNLRIDAEAEAIVRWLARAGVPCVLLKGVARRAAVGLYPYSNARATSDVDVLVPAPDAARVWDGLRAAGYASLSPERAASGTDGCHHLPPLIGERRVAVEIHTTTSRAVTPEEAWSRSSRDSHALTWSGIEVQVAPATELLWHGITHAAQEHEMYEGGFRLRYFQDAAVILAAPGAIDWDEIVRRLGSQEVTDRVTTVRWLGAAANLAGTVLPNGLSGVAPFPLEESLRWRLGIFRRLGRWPRLAGPCLAEEVRVALGQPATPVVPSARVLARWRHRVGATGARAAYRLWRAARRGSTTPDVIYRPALG
jgi:hypothetical protein